MSGVEPERALRLTMDVWHPGCWVLDVTEQVDVGLLGYGIYTREDGRATTHYTIYADTQAVIEHALASIRESAAVSHVAELTQGYRRRAVSTPGNAKRELLVEHDGRTQISEAFTSRGFAYAEPVDAYGNIERWTVLSTDDRETIRSHIEAICDQEGAEITLTGVVGADRTTEAESESLPIARLSHRQREVFELARERGYYAWPRVASAGELADELGITPSTLHEHLHKIEAKLLGPHE